MLIESMRVAKVPHKGTAEVIISMIDKETLQKKATINNRAGCTYRSSLYTKQLSPSTISHFCISNVLFTNTEFKIVDKLYTSTPKGLH